MAENWFGALLGNFAADLPEHMAFELSLKPGQWRWKGSRAAPFCGSFKLDWFVKSSSCEFCKSWAFICRTEVNGASLCGGEIAEINMQEMLGLGPRKNEDGRRTGWGAESLEADHRMSCRTSHFASNIKFVFFSYWRQLKPQPEGKKIAFIWHVYPFSFPEKLPSRWRDIARNEYSYSVRSFNFK